MIKVKGKDEENVKYIHKERKQSDLSRAFYVGDHVLVEDVKASFDQGILTVIIPKYDPNKPETKYNIPIE